MPTVASETPEPSMAYRLHASELIATLRSDERSGLSDEEARARLAQYGPNELAAERARPCLAAVPVAVSGCARHPASHRDSNLRGALGR